MKIFDTLEIRVAGIDNPITVKEFLEKSKEDKDFFNKDRIRLVDLADARFSKFALDCRSKMFKEFLHKSEENIRNIIKENSKILSQNEVAKFKIADIQQMIYDDEKEVIRQRLENLKLSWSDWRIVENLLFRANSLLVSLSLIDSAGNAFKDNRFGIFDSLNNTNKTDIRYMPAISYMFSKPSFNLLYLADGKGEPDVASMEPLNVMDLKYVRASFTDISDCIEGTSDGGAFAANVYDSYEYKSFFDDMIGRKITRKCPEELKEDYLEVVDRIEKVYNHLIDNFGKGVVVPDGIDILYRVNRGCYGAALTKDEPYFQACRDYAEKGITGADVGGYRIEKYLPITEAVKAYMILELYKINE